MSNPLITVIIPVYNVEKYLKRCIESVLKQTYTNLEIIIINDGSTDKSKNICDNYELLDIRVKVIHQRNAGVSYSRNKGLDIAKGDYIMFVDGDDYIKKDMIENLYIEINNNNNISYVACGYINENKKLNQNMVIPSKKYFMTGKEALYTYFNQSKFEMNYCNVWGKLYNKDIFKSLRFKNVNFEDFLIMPYILLQCKNIVYLPYAGYYYSYNYQSITNNDDVIHQEKLYIDTLDILEEHLHFYKQERYKNMYVITEIRLIEKILNHCLIGTIPFNSTRKSKILVCEHLLSFFKNYNGLTLKVVALMYIFLGNKITRYIYKLFRLTNKNND